MSVYEAYIEQLVQRMLPFQGKEVPDDLVNAWLTLDTNGQNAVRARLSSLLKKQEPAPAPKNDIATSKQMRLLAILCQPGWHSRTDLCNELDTTPNSLAGMIHRLRHEGNHHVRVHTVNNLSSYCCDETPPPSQPPSRPPPPPPLTLRPADNGPLTRAERGALGARAARVFNKRPIGVVDPEALRLLEEAGGAGLTITAWASALHYTEGGLYRRITTMRRNGHDIRLQNTTGRKKAYVLFGEKSQQQSLFHESIRPVIMSVKEVAELFAVSKNTIHHWRATGKLPQPKNYHLQTHSVIGWDEKIIEQLLNTKPTKLVCLQCGSMFDKHRTKKYCSRTCQLNAASQKRRNRTATRKQVLAEPGIISPAAGPETKAPDMMAITDAINDSPAATSRSDIIAALEVARFDAARHHKRMMEAIQSLKDDKEIERYPAVAALHALDLHLMPGINPDGIIDVLCERLDARSVRDWLSKLQNKIKRLTDRANARAAAD